MRIEMIKGDYKMPGLIYNLFIIFILLISFNLFSTGICASSDKSAFDPDKRDWSFVKNINACHQGDIFYYVYSGSGPQKDVESLKQYLTDMAVKNRQNNPEETIKVVEDKDFSDDLWGKGTVYLVGPYKEHLLLQKYFSNIPFVIDSKGISVYKEDKSLFMQESEKNPGLIFHWPQPGGKGRAVIYTGPDYSSVKGIFSQHHGPTDFVVTNRFFKYIGSFLGFCSLGFFDKTVKPWKFDFTRCAFEGSHRDFFVKEFKYVFNQEKLAPAVEQTIVFTTGETIEGALFLIDKMRLLIRHEKKGKTEYLIKNFDDIEKLEKGGSVLSAIYKPRDKAYRQTQECRLSLKPDFMETIITPVEQLNNTHKTLEEEFFCSTPPLISKTDIFGETIEVKSEFDQENNLYSHTAQLNMPVEPGDTILTVSAFKYKKTGKTDEGIYQYKSNHFPGPRTNFKSDLYIPCEKILHVSPKPVEIKKSENYHRLRFERIIEPGEGIYIEVDFKGESN
jgi:hypothetical protein